ncbi:hypothetical protein V5O48_001097 [Marasmius crinis-equi]|uniref:SnoaL-like domain-containing protein n=1 Tax=Marasmius crinis-equi TaxID=585013 RepID=A0ABR3FZW0_9AGAR
MGGSLRDQLLAATKSIRDAFMAGKGLDPVLSLFSTSPKTFAIEYGEPSLAPFLGREYVGLAAIQSYFEIIVTCLSFKDMEFVDFVIDTESRRVACKARATFTWNSTGESWNETFAYILDYDEENKITGYQVWSDSGATYLARVGKLVEVRKEHEQSQ